MFCVAGGGAGDGNRAASGGHEQPGEDAVAGEAARESQPLRAHEVKKKRRLRCMEAYGSYRNGRGMMRVGRRGRNEI